MNKRYYEHTLPIIRGSLSNTYANSTIFMEGNYELPSDSIYVESLTYSATPVFPRGARNEMHVKFLHDNLIQISFDLPGQGRRIDEFWVRVVTPKPKM